MHIVDIIRRITSANNRIEKEQILYDAWMSGERNFFTGMRLGLSPYVDFVNIKVPKLSDPIEPPDETIPHVDDPDSTFTFDNFLFLISKHLLHGIGNGETGKIACDKAALSCDTLTWNMFYRQIIRKQFTFMIEPTIINKILKKLSKSDETARQYLIPYSGTQRAEKYDDSDALRVGKQMLDVHISGVRIITIIDKELNCVSHFDDIGRAFSPIKNIEPILKQFMHELPCSMMFDGVMTEAKGKLQVSMTNPNGAFTNMSSANITFFDCMPLSDFLEGKSELPQKTRHEILSGLFGLMLTLASNGELRVLPKLYIDFNEDGSREVYEDFVEQALADGHTNIMIKGASAAYTINKNSAWKQIRIGGK